MTPTTTNHRLTADEILEIKNTLAETTIECVEFKSRIHNAEDGDILNKFADMLVVGYDFRVYSREDCAQMNSEIESSQLLRWWVNRVNIALRSTSVDPIRIDHFIATAMSFTTGSDTITNYAALDLKYEDWLDVINKYPIIRVGALWNMFSIPFYISILTAPVHEGNPNESTTTK